MKKMAIVAAALIGTMGIGTAAFAQSTEASQQKVLRYQKDQQQKAWHEQQLNSGRTMGSGTYGAPARQSFGQADPENGTEEAAAPRNLSIPGSGAAIYSYDAQNKSWAYGY